MTTLRNRMMTVSSSAVPLGSPAADHLHRPCPGQTQLLCDLYIDFLRSLLMEQDRRIVDLERRLAGKPLTATWLDGIRQR